MARAIVRSWPARAGRRVGGRWHLLSVCRRWRVAVCLQRVVISQRGEAQVAALSPGLEASRARGIVGIRSPPPLRSLTLSTAARARKPHGALGKRSGSEEKACSGTHARAATWRRSSRGASCS